MLIAFVTPESLEMRFFLSFRAFQDPQFLEDRRWVIEHLFDPAWKQEYRDINDKKYSFFAFNIGIGYPF